MGHDDRVLGCEHRPRRQVVERDLVPLPATRRRDARRRARALISSSSTMRPWAVSTRNIRPGWSRPLRTTRGGVDVEHADLRGEHDQAVVGHPVAGGAQAVAVEHGADDRAVGERDRGRAVPGLHRARRGNGRRHGGPGPSPGGSPTLRGSSSARRGRASVRRGGGARAPRRRRPSRSPRACRSGRSARGRRG